jgi:hypothetical protein
LLILHCGFQNILEIQRTNLRTLVNDEAATSLTPVAKYSIARIDRVIKIFAGLKHGHALVRHQLR